MISLLYGKEDGIQCVTDNHDVIEKIGHTKDEQVRKNAKHKKEL